MTDRIHSLTVALEGNVREDDVQNLVAAIKQLRGVLDVRLNVADAAFYTAELRARQEAANRLFEAAENMLKL